MVRCLGKADFIRTHRPRAGDSVTEGRQVPEELRKERVGVEGDITDQGR
jgi:hypothetical protein